MTKLALNNQKTLAKLRDLFNSTEACESRKPLFLEVVAFVEFFKRQPPLKVILGKFENDKKRDFVVLKKCQNRTMVEMNQVYRSLVKLQKSKHLDNNLLSSELDSYGKRVATMKSRGVSVGDLHSNLYRALQIISGTFPQHRSLIKKYIAPDESFGYAFSPSYSLWIREDKRIDTVKLNREWYCWDQLMDVDTKYTDGDLQFGSLNVDECRRCLRKVFEFTKRHLDIEVQSTPQKVFWFDETIFNIRLIDGTIRQIDFTPKKNLDHIPDPYYLLKALVSLLKKKNEGVVAIERQRLVARVKTDYPHPDKIDNNWLNDTKHNLRSMVPNDMKEIIVLSDLDRKTDEFSFSLRLTN